MWAAFGSALALLRGAAGWGLHWLSLQVCRELVLDMGSRPSVSLYCGSISHNCSEFPPKTGAGSWVFQNTRNSSFSSMIEFADDVLALSVFLLWF